MQPRRARSAGPGGGSIADLVDTSYLQRLIHVFPDVPVVLLHASYPYTREAGYLATVYPNVYLDFGLVFPMLSKHGQKSVVRQMLELTPYSKLLWSSDGHWFPESFVLAALQTREALGEVLGELVAEGALSYAQAADLARAVLFENANRLYDLQLQPDWRDAAGTTRIPVVSSPAPLLPSSSPPLLPSSLPPPPPPPLSPPPPPSPSQPPPPSPPSQPSPQSPPSPPSPSFEQVLGQFKDVKFLRMQWVDYCGIVRLRVLPISVVKRKFETGWDVAITAAALGILADDSPVAGASPTGMYSLAPVWSSFRPLTAGPTTSVGTAQHAAVMCDMEDRTGRSEPPYPRAALTSAVALAKRDHDLELLVGFETEVMLYDRNSAGELFVHGQQAWSMASALTPKRLACLEEVVLNLEAAGVVVAMFHAESADGQFEIVTGPLPAIAAVDTLYHTRQVVEQTAARHGLRASLHPKPYRDQAGTSCHTHFSLSRRDAEPAFVAGVLQHLKALMATTTPSVASFDRLCDNAWACGTWVCWGQENREVPLRQIAGPNPHWEMRCVDATANMYLAIAALIHCGLLGIMDHATLPPGCLRTFPLPQLISYF